MRPRRRGSGQAVRQRATGVVLRRIDAHRALTPLERSYLSHGANPPHASSPRKQSSSSLPTTRRFRRLGWLVFFKPQPRRGEVMVEHEAPAGEIVVSTRRAVCSDVVLETSSERDVVTRYRRTGIASRSDNLPHAASLTATDVERYFLWTVDACLAASVRGGTPRRKIIRWTAGLPKSAFS